MICHPDWKYHGTIKYDTKRQVFEVIPPPKAEGIIRKEFTSLKDAEKYLYSRIALALPNTKT